MSSSQAQQEARRNSLMRDSQLLEHEQLHFDIAEAAVRKIAARFAEFKAACATPGGTDAIQQMVVQADRELQEEHQRYDRETAHGINARAQDQWTLKIRKALN